MNFNTALSCGDTAWIYYGHYHTGVQQATVGQIRIEYTDTLVSPNGYDEKVPTKEYKEVYMCDETGIGSGSLLTYGETIFKTKEECEVAFAEKIAKDAAEKLERAEHEKADKLSKENMLRMQLAEIEALKLESV